MIAKVRVWRLPTPSVAVCPACTVPIRKGDRYQIDDSGIFHERCHTSYNLDRHKWNRLLADDDLRVITGTVRHPRTLRRARHTRGT